MTGGPVWYCVLYSSGREEAVPGLAALEHALGRRSPRVIWYAEAAIHRCQVCGTAGPWGPGWVAWERYGERHERRGEGPDVYCTEACARIENPGHRWPEWMGVHDEPRPPEVRRAIWRAKADEQKRKRQTTDHRRVPMPKWPGRGFCSWCGEKIDPTKTKATSWHPGCVPIYFLHSRLENQFAFLIRRDGQRCAWPGCAETRGLEVDHRTALWSVDQTLPLEERRWFYGPGNLWLLCGKHHKAKTRQEAAQRAAQRRSSIDQLALPIPLA